MTDDTKAFIGAGVALLLAAISSTLFRDGQVSGAVVACGFLFVGVCIRTTKLSVNIYGEKVVVPEEKEVQ